jgi:hypothetical protein
MTTQDDGTLKAVVQLALPTVPVALEGGLIPIEHHQAPIKVNFTVWPGAEPGYIYQLLFDDNRVPPEKPILDSHKPGDILEVQIPAELLTEGKHAVAYRIYSPNTEVENFSDSIPIQIDKTAPGAPHLGPILLPPEVQDGLTSDELEAMNNVLPGRIAGYTGMAAGDVVRTYWGAVEGPLAVVDSNDMGLQRVMVDFPRALLEQIGDGQQAVHYTVTDLAGNVSMDSEVATIELKLAVVTPLPVPILKEAQNGFLDPANALNGATVVIAASANLREGEKLLARWNGPKGSDSKELTVGAGQAGTQISLLFASALVSVNDGQTVEVSYNVTRRSGVVQESDKILVKVLSAALDLSAPTMDTVGADGVVRPSLIVGPDALVRASYRGMDATDSVKVRWVGKTTFNGASQLVGNNTRLTFNIPKSFIEQSLGSNATVTYLVTRNGVERESHALALTVREEMVLDTSPASLPGKIYLMPGYPDLLPAFPTGTTVLRQASGGRPPYTYSSSNPKVAQVDSQGLTSVRGNGNATITVADAGGERKSYSVSVSGVIECHGVGAGSLAQMSAAASGIGARLPSIQQLGEIHAAYGNRWPMGNGNYWSSTLAKQSLLIKWYYVKNLNTGQNYMLAHHNTSLAVALR